MKHRELIEQLTLEEKAALCSGKDFWHLNGVERLGLGSIMVSDGPHGLRKHNDKKSKTDLMDSVPAICFPTASATACSWDEDLLFEMGQALGDECRAEKISVLLGPGLNVKRSPLCGRNFEYFSEDPLLAGKMAAAMVKGIQSKGVGACVKHFAANNQETRRMTIDTAADERTLREIYLTGFETVVKEAKPWCVMNAYNKLNGKYCAENKWLLNDVLREEWGFDGVIMTDWGAENEIADGINAGQNLEMPGSNGLGAAKLVKAVKCGELDEKLLDERVDELIELIIKSQETLGNYEYSKEQHHSLVRKIAENSMVLLKNEDGILPLSKSEKVAIIGEFAKAPRYQGAGSSQINASFIDNAFDVMLQQGLPFVYARGYDKTKDVTDLALLDEAVKCAKACKKAVVFIGLTDEFESEGFDRIHMSIPKCHIDLVKAVSRANPNTVVVLAGGSPVEMPWACCAKAILNAYLGGQASGSAAVDLLYGDVNPSGKLAETVPVSLASNPSFNYFPGSLKSVEYREALYVGYRYYDKTGKDVLFPFGHGLSYTEFEYSDLKLSKKAVKDTDTVKVSFKVKNTGKRDGAETVQLYVADIHSTAFRPVKELKGFKKVFLKAGEEKTVELELSKRAFAYYNVNIHDWHVESGDFIISVGASSRDIRLEARLRVTSTENEVEIPDLSAVAPSHYSGNIENVTDEEFEALLGREIPYKGFVNDGIITVNSSLEEATSPAGQKINALLVGLFKTISKGNAAQERMMTSMALQIPIRCFISMSMGVFTPEMADGLCDILNGGAAFRGIGKILGGITNAVQNIGTLMKSI